ncbi:MAG: hypothetical protein CL569_05650 [Alphaproteobacteria bacterium]|nr:hypothetical protein [Alphaproteobacteria bacterium]
MTGETIPVAAGNHEGRRDIGATGSSTSTRLGRVIASALKCTGEYRRAPFSRHRAVGQRSRLVEAAQEQSSPMERHLHHGKFGAVAMLESQNEFTTPFVAAEHGPRPRPRECRPPAHAGSAQGSFSDVNLKRKTTDCSDRPSDEIQTFPARRAQIALKVDEPAAPHAARREDDIQNGTHQRPRTVDQVTHSSHRIIWGNHRIN